MSLQVPSLAIGNTEPEDPKVGDLWYHTELHELRVYKDYIWMVCATCTVCACTHPESTQYVKYEDYRDDVCLFCSQEARLDHVTKRYNKQNAEISELKREISVLQDDLRMAREANDLVAAIQRALPLLSDADRAFFKLICYQCREHQFQVDFLFRAHEDMTECSACKEDGFDKKTDLILTSTSGKIGHTPDSVGGVTIVTCYQRLKAIYGFRIAMEKLVRALAPLLPEA